MALVGILRPGFIQIRVLDLEAAVAHYVNHVGLHEVCRDGSGRAYLKAIDEFDHHSIVLRAADSAGLDCMAFKVLDDSDLDAFEKRVTEAGYQVDRVAAAEQPGIGRRIGFTIPSGHRIELYQHADMSDPRPMLHNPDVWEFEPHGMQARRFDHALLYGPNIEETLRFFEQVLDFRCAERIDMPDGLLAVWLTCGCLLYTSLRTGEKIAQRMHEGAAV